MSTLTVDVAVLPPISTNCYIIGGETEAIVVDPASPDIGAIKECVAHRTVTLIVVTHGHYDHIAGVDALRNALNARVAIHANDHHMLLRADANLSSLFGIPCTFKAADTLLQEGDTISVESTPFTVIHTPGHTKGGICLYAESERILVSGDTLFAYGVGRTDFPDGDTRALYNGITEKIFTLPDDTRVYPGHDAYGFLLGERKALGL